MDKRYSYLSSAKYYFNTHYLPCVENKYDALAVIYENTIWFRLFCAAEAGEI